MGSWSYGMLASDHAYDVIGSTGKESFKFLELYIREKRKDHKGILALAAHCLDEKVEIPEVTKKVVLKSVKNQLLHVNEWVDGDERKQALERFRDRVLGKTVDRLDNIIDNMCLLSKISLADADRDTIKKLIKKGLK